MSVDVRWHQMLFSLEESHIDAGFKSHDRASKIYQ